MIINGPDALCTALVESLNLHNPFSSVVTDHEALPDKIEDMPAGGVLAVFLFADDPVEEISDSVGNQDRRATFRVELRYPRASHLLHSTAALRKSVALAIKTDPTLGGLASNSSLGKVAILVHESNSQIGCASVDVLVDYFYDPEAP